MQKYNPKKIEAKWQKLWQQKKVFQASDFAPPSSRLRRTSKATSDKGKDFSNKSKKYVLCEFPYPSGAGLHMGHLRPYVAGDVYARFNRLNGFETVFPMGWDAFGLPAENYALKMGVHPSVTTKKNVANAKKQMQSWGLSFDWSREINSTDPNYYKWTQWIFLQFYKAGLAYEATGLINWCPKDKTGLANEEVIDGKCERCGTTVEKKELRQWYLKITAYAEKLLEGLKNLPEWPEAVKLQQENWIGKKTGINITYEIDRVDPVGAGLGRPQSDDGRLKVTPTTKPNFVILHGYTGHPNNIYYPWLKQQLESKGFAVTIPSLPNPDMPSEKEQVEYVLQNCIFDQNTVLLGHSLGSVVALKVLEKINTKIAGLVLTGGFIDAKFKDHSRPFEKLFDWKFKFDEIKKKVGYIKVLHDVNDHAVSDDQALVLAKSLGVSLQKAKAQESHFGAKQEPLILQALLPTVTCFTTRPDTNFGATFVVLGPEHQLLTDRNVLYIEPAIWKEIEAYKLKAVTEAEEDRTAENRKKTGVVTGLYCINNLNGHRMPLYVADYVLGNVGTGAVVGVPGHDKRDFEFAQVFNLPVVRVVQKNMGDTAPITSSDAVQEDEGFMVNSDFLNGLNIHQATVKIMDFLEEKGWGKRVVNYKLRDWVFSRQRYWGEPIPIIHCADCGIVPVPEKDLPVKLPQVKKYEPTGTGESPLATISKWVNVKCPKCGGKAKRETNTMPQWAGSSWYWLRYTDPKNKKEFASIKKQKYWTPVDVYFGGMEHTTLHLLYSRFWNLFLYDQGLATVKEPYTKRQPHGIVLGPDGEKMSKSRGNVVDPQLIVKEFGADTLRMYELFLGPHEATVSWNDKGAVGVKRFLDRVWGWAGKFKVESLKLKVKDSEQVEKELHKLIKKITEDIQAFHFNTSISSFMEFHNKIINDFISKESIKTFLILLYPFAPHMCEELNTIMGGKKSLQFEHWPKFDASKILETTAEIVVQVNGKVKAKFSALVGSTQEQAQTAAMKVEAVKNTIGQSNIKRVIYVPNKLINFVI